MHSVDAVETILVVMVVGEELLKNGLSSHIMNLNNRFLDVLCSWNSNIPGERHLFGDFVRNFVVDNSWPLTVDINWNLVVDSSWDFFDNFEGLGLVCGSLNGNINLGSDLVNTVIGLLDVLSPWDCSLDFLWNLVVDSSWDLNINIVWFKVVLNSWDLNIDDVVF